MEKITPLTFKEKFSFGTGAVGKDMAFNIISAFYMLYLTLVVGLHPMIVGVVFALSRVFDAVNDPVMGSIVDNTRSKWGKFRPWLMIGTITNCVVLILMHMDFNLGNTGEYVFYLSLYVLWGITYTIVDIPYWSMVPAISVTKEQRNSISSIARICASAGGAIITGGVPVILGTYGYANDVFLTMAMVIAFVFLLSISLTAANTKEKIVVLGEKVKLSHIIKIVRENDQLVAYILAFGLYAVAGTILNTSGIYYFKVVLDREELMTVFLILGGVGGAGLSMILYPYLAKRFGRRNLYIFAMFATIAGFTIMSFFSYVFGTAGFVLYGIFFGGWLMFFAQGIAMVGSTVMLADVVDYGELKSGNRTENVTFSMQCFLYKASAAVALLLMGVAIQIGDIPTIGPTGEFTGVVTESGKLIITFVLLTLPIFFAIPATIFYLKLYKLNGKYHDEVLEKLSLMREGKIPPLSQQPEADTDSSSGH